MSASTRHLDEAMVKLSHDRDDLIQRTWSLSASESTYKRCIPLLMAILQNAIDPKEPFAGMTLVDEAVQQEIDLATAILGRTA